MAASTVTANTSIVLVSSIDTKIYLSSVGYPGHIVTIKDFTGVASQGNPIVVSTSQDVFFADGSISTLLYSPFSYLTVSSKTPTTWQILNNVGFFTTLSNAFVEQLTTTNAYIGTISSVEEYVSSSLVGRIDVTKELILTGNVDILGNLIVSGVVDLLSTVDIRDTVYISTGLTVAGPVSFGSTLSVTDDMNVSGYISTLNSITVGQGLRVDTSLYVESALAPKNFSIQSLKMDFVDIGGAFETGESLSVGSNLYLGGSLFGFSSLLLESSLIVQGQTTIQDAFHVEKNFTTNSLTSFSSGYISQDVSAKSLHLIGTLSTANSLFLTDSLTVQGDTIVSSVVVNGEVLTNSLVVNGNAEISSILTTGDLVVNGGLVSLSDNFHTSSLSSFLAYVNTSLYVEGTTSVSSFVSTQTNFAVGDNLFVGSTLFVKGSTQVYGDLFGPSDVEIYGNLSTGSLLVNQDLNIQGDLTIPGIVNAATLGASINITLSTLTLSNTLSVSNVATIPILESSSNRLNLFPQHMIAGINARDFSPSAFLNAQPEANIRNTLQDLSQLNDKKVISTLRVSTIYNTNLLSTFVVGPSNYINPLADISGYLLMGSSDTFKFLVGSFSVFPGNLSISTNGAFYNAYAASNQVNWVAVGRNPTQSNTIQYSSNYGRTWNSVQTGGFSPLPFPPPSNVGIGNDVVYMSTTLSNTTFPLWVATGWGSPSPGAGASIQFSFDGINWQSAGGSIFPAGFFGNTLLYYPSPLEDGLVFAGGYAGPGIFGIKYSGNGFVWQQATPQLGMTEFVCRDFTIGPNNEKLLAIGHNNNNSSNRIYIADTTGYSNAWSNLASVPTVPTGTFNTIAYGNGFYVTGTSATSSNPLTSIWRSLETNGIPAGPWTPAQQGGFSGGTNKIRFDTNVGAFVAVGSNFSNFNVQVSIDGTNWFVNTFPFPGPLSSLAGGTLAMPDNNSRFFTANTETRFQTTISSVSMIASTIRASSFTAEYFIGDASKITNLTTFSDKMGVSTILTQIFTLNSTIDTSISTLFDTVEASTCQLTTTPFLSTFSIWLAAGIDSLPNGNIQQSRNVSNWNRASNANFKFFGTSIVGNSNVTSPFFVATGADSQPERTIQYSEDGFIWTPAESGGFVTPVTAGFYKANVAEVIYYLSTTLTPPFSVLQGPRYLVGGDAFGTTSTLFYSDDGSNYTAATGTSNCLANQILDIKYFNTWSIAQNSNLDLINSSNGIDWNPTSLTGIQAYSYGSTPQFGSRWYALQNGVLWTSIDQTGSNWFNTNIFYPFLQEIIDLKYNNQYFAAISPKQLFLLSSISGGWYAVPDINSLGSFFDTLTSLFWEQTQQRWFLGAQAQSNINTLLTSSNGLNWQNIETGGFSSGITTYGVGYAALFASSVTLLGGIGVYDGSVQPPSAQILQGNSMIFPPSPSGGSTQPLLPQALSSNVFSTTVYGLAFTSSATQTYHYIAVGDGITPQRTIARSSNIFSNGYTDTNFSWIPAVTGGFSPAGYGALYYSTADVWLAVGKSVASTATIQYSSDTANWFATNFSGGIPDGGRGIAKMRDDSLYPNRLVVVGEDSDTSNQNTIVYSDDGFNWIASTEGFFGAGYGVAPGIVSNAPGLVAVGSAIDTIGNFSEKVSIQYSQNGVDWFINSGGGFNVAGYGVAFGKDYFSGSNLWVAVGDYGISNLPEYTIQHSFDGIGWSPANPGQGFAFAGYGVTYNDASGVFVAVGKAEKAEGSVLYSGDGVNWATLFPNSGGFLFEKTNAATLGLFSQQITTEEKNPFIRMPKFVLYERDTPFNYAIPSMRMKVELSSLYSADFTINEVLTLTSNNLITINTYSSVDSNLVSVLGDVQTSSLIITGSVPRYENMTVSSLIVSTLQVNNQLLGESIITPSWTFGTQSTANVFSLITLPNTEPGGGIDFSVLNINDALFSKLLPFNNTDTTIFPRYGVNTSNPSYTLDVSGTAAFSTLFTSIYNQENVYFTQPNKEYIFASTLSIFEGTMPDIHNKNTIQAATSSITFNSLLTINYSTQRVGVFTSNPQFDLDVQTLGLISNLQTPSIRTGALFFTLQSS